MPEEDKDIQIAELKEALILADEKEFRAAVIDALKTLFIQQQKIIQLLSATLPEPEKKKTKGKRKASIVDSEDI